MKHFLRIAENVDVMPLLHAIHAKPDLWDENTLRTTHPLSPHREASDIWLFFNETPDYAEQVVNDIQTHPYRAWRELPQARAIILDLMRRVDGVQLGRAIITKLVPGAVIPPHIDQGAPVDFYKRYQVVLQSNPGAVFQIEDEKVGFRQGEVWLINNKAEHGVVNNSNDDRVVMIVDIRIC